MLKVFTEQIYFLTVLEIIIV